MRATYREIPKLISNLKDFEGNSMRAHTYKQDGGLYVIYSYQTVIATIDKFGICKLNTEYYSSTTSRQQNIIKRCFPKYLQVSHEELNGWRR